MTVNDRISQLIEILNIKNKDFAERINIKPNTLSIIKMNQRKVTDRIASDICREFGVNDDWLLNGNGEIFNSEPINFIDSLIKQYNLTNRDKEILESYVNMGEENRELFYNFIKTMSKTKESE